MIISGKSDNYFPDDQEAYIAEVNARKKGHPNYFTDVPFLLEQIKDYCAIVKESYFLRKGDMLKHKGQESMPERFYEWVILLET